MFIFLSVRSIAYNKCDAVSFVLALAVLCSSKAYWRSLNNFLNKTESHNLQYKIRLNFLTRKNWDVMGEKCFFLERKFLGCLNLRTTTVNSVFLFFLGSQTFAAMVLEMHLWRTFFSNTLSLFDSLKNRTVIQAWLRLSWSSCKNRSAV